MRHDNSFDRSLIVVDQDFVTDSWNSFFNDFGEFNKSVFKPSTSKTKGFQPMCDITEAKDHYLVSLDIPGIDQKDLNIEVDNQRLKISGERLREVSEGEDSSATYYERSFGKFVRTFNLPPEIKAEDIQAQYQDGVLKVAIPKLKKEEPKKIKININEGKKGFFQKLTSSTKSES